MNRRHTQQTALDGRSAETLAEQFLLAQGLRTQCKNYSCKLGEIDLVMLHHETLVFVEVRLRTNPYFSSAAESVTWRKQQKIIRTAQVYLQQRQLTEGIACRFDVIAFTKGHLHTTPDWIQNAFGC